MNKKVHPFIVMKRGVFWVIIETGSGDVVDVRKSQLGAFNSMVELIKAWRGKENDSIELKTAESATIAATLPGHTIDASIMSLFGFFSRTLIAGGMIYLIGYFALKTFFVFFPIR